MEEYNKDAWETLIERCEEVGVDAFEVNFSCPHGMPERKMGMAMGQDCTVLEVRAFLLRQVDAGQHTFDCYRNSGGYLLAAMCTQCILAAVIVLRPKFCRLWRLHIQERD